MIWDRVVKTIHNHHHQQERRQTRPSIESYYENQSKVDQKWKHLIIFFSKCQTYVGKRFFHFESFYEIQENSQKPPQKARRKFREAIRPYDTRNLVTGIFIDRQLFYFANRG